jgi:hypothetical protein
VGTEVVSPIPLYEVVSNVVTDTFSFEFVLYELATGHHPFCRRFVTLSIPRCHAVCHANRPLAPAMSSSVMASDER